MVLDCIKFELKNLSPSYVIFFFLATATIISGTQDGQKAWPDVGVAERPDQVYSSHFKATV